MCIPAVIIAGAISIWTYRHTVPRTTPLRRRVLIVLRTAAMALIVFILFQPILTLTKTQERSPKIAILLDNSRSMLLPASYADTSINRISLLKKNISSVFPTDVLNARDELSVQFFSEGAVIVDTPLTKAVASLKADGSVTDISSAFAVVQDQQKLQNISAAILFSDGAYTAGSNPLYAAERLGIPIYTVGIGDSTEHRDVGITSLFTNDLATVGAAQPLDITIHSSGANDGEHVTVSLYAENEKIGQEQIALKAGSNDEQVTFTITPKQEGALKLTARVSSLASGEATITNNVSIRYVTVLKNIFKIVLFAGAPSSDVSFIRDYFSSRKEISLSTFIQKQGAEFYEGAPTNAALKDADLVILVGFPIASSSNESIALVKTMVATEGHALLFIPSRTIDLVKLKALEDVLPFNINNTSVSNNELNVSASVSVQTLNNPILRADKELTAAPKWEGLAPLTKTETHFAPKPESDVLAEATLQGVKIGEPLILSRSVGRSRQIAFTGYGLWRWKLTSFGRERAFASLSHSADSSALTQSALDLLLGNATRWLVMHDDRKRVRIEPTQKLYDAGESIEFSSQVYDESYQPLDNAIVSVTITGAGLPSPMNITLEPRSSGRYALRLPQGLAKGDYIYKGTAVANGKTIGGDGGRFNVGEYSIEFAEPRMRSELLREIARRSGGKFFTPENDAELLKEIRSLTSFQSKKLEEKTEYEARVSWYLLALAIALFSTEWFLRKRSGML